jgi:cell division protein FtsB
MHRRESEASRDQAAQDTPSIAVPTISFTRRRLALLVAGLFALWLVGVFARQVGAATSASDQADQLRARNASMRLEVASLDQELALIKQPAFAAQVARGYLLGTAKEIPFTVDPEAPAIPANAPGSMGIKPEVTAKRTGPLESWLEVLFGSQ